MRRLISLAALLVILISAMAANAAVKENKIPLQCTLTEPGKTPPQITLENKGDKLVPKGVYIEVMLSTGTEKVKQWFLPQTEKELSTCIERSCEGADAAPHMRDCERSRRRGPRRPRDLPDEQQRLID